MKNIEVLTQAGVIKDPDQISQEMSAKINALSSDEVTHLISIKAKLGEGDLSGHAKVMMV